MRPLRAPVDPQFAPYYEQILKGNVGVIAEYCDAAVVAREHSSSFYELLGRLVTMRFYRVADMILSDVERRGVIGWPSNQDSYRYWYRKLKPLCDSARAFIRKAHQSETTLKREDLWREYVFRPLPTVRFVEFIGKADEEHLQGEMNARQQKEHHRGLEELLQWSGSLRKVQWSDVPQKPSDLNQVEKFGVYRLVPKNVFFDLALTRIDLARRTPYWTPAQVARRYASRIAGISESTASRVSVRK